MDPFEFGMTVHRQGGVPVVTLRGDLDIRDAERVREELARLAGSAVVVDLFELTFMDARALSALLAARGELEACGNTLVIRNARGVVRRAFEVTGLGYMLDQQHYSQNGSSDHDSEGV